MYIICFWQYRQVCVAGGGIADVRIIFRYREWIVVVKVIAKVRVKDRIRGRRAFIFYTYGMQLYM